MKILNKQLINQNSILRKQAFATTNKTATKTDKAPTVTNKQLVDRDLKYVAHNYKPLPLVISKGRGINVWDVEGKKYYDFLCGYSSTNQGHCHPRIMKTMNEQAKKLTMTSRAFHNDKMGEFAEYITGILGYDKLLPMNSGVEATETSIKLARRWGYVKKGIPDNQANVLIAKGAFWGRTITASGASDDPQRYTNFGPFTPGFELVEYNNIPEIQKKLENDKNICAIMLEPIQGEQGVIIPDEGYLKKVSALCKKHNVLLITDEIQTGLGRCGKFMCYEWEGIKPDIVTMGKALSGGFMPVSGVVCNDNIMMTINPGDHGSTYGGNPLGMAIAKTAIEVILDEKLVENSLKMGDILHEKLLEIKNPLIKSIRGRGLFRGLELVHDAKVDGDDLAYALMKRGLLTKSTHTYTVRLAPALVINENEIMKAAKIIKNAIKDISKINRERKRTDRETKKAEKEAKMQQSQMV